MNIKTVHPNHIFFRSTCAYSYDFTCWGCSCHIFLGRPAHFLFWKFQAFFRIFLLSDEFHQCETLWIASLLIYNQKITVPATTQHFYTQTEEGGPNFNVLLLFSPILRQCIAAALTPCSNEKLFLFLQNPFHVVLYEDIFHIITTYWLEFSFHKPTCLIEITFFVLTWYVDVSTLIVRKNTLIVIT